MKFTKMQGLGNDYVYVNCVNKKMENASEMSVLVSDRHLGIGSDGLILINSSDIADFEMEMYNADGSRSEMCGNGIRCVGKYVYDYGLTDKTQISIETLAGIKYLELMAEDGKVRQVRVNMGSPVLKPEGIPIALKGENVIDVPIMAGESEYRMTGVGMGNPHTVVFMEDLERLNIEKTGPLFENHEYFPNRVNTEFVKVIDRKHVQMRVWERGSGETRACGTGACAVAVACILNGLTEDEITVTLPGGDLQIQWDRKEDIVYMTGPAEVVFEGEWNHQK